MRVVELGYETYSRDPVAQEFPGLGRIVGDVRGRLGMRKKDLLAFIAELQTEDLGELAQLELGGYTPLWTPPRERKKRKRKGHTSRRK